MLKTIMITALILSAGLAAQAEVKLTFDLDEVIVQASEKTDEAPIIYLTQNDKSFTLQVVCRRLNSTILLFNKTPFTAMTAPNADEYFGEADVSYTDCKKMSKCVLSKSINKDAAISVSVDSQTETFKVDSLGENCKDIN